MNVLFEACNLCVARQRLLQTDVNATSPQGQTALMLIILHGPSNVVDIVSLLLEAGADVTLADHLGHTALMHACLLGRETVVPLLMDAGANVLRTNHAGKTPMMLAQEAGQNNVLGFLVQRTTLLVNSVHSLPPS